MSGIVSDDVPAVVAVVVVAGPLAGFVVLAPALALALLPSVLALLNISAASVESLVPMATESVEATLN